MKKIIIPILLLFISSHFCNGQKGKEVRLDIVYHIEDADETEKLYLLTLIPADVENRQKVDNIHFSEEPDTVFFIGDNRYAEFVFFPPLPDRIEIAAELTIWRSDYKNLSGVQSTNIPSDEELERNLGSEAYIEWEHPDFIYFAQSLKGNNRLSTVRNIYNFINPDLKQAVRKTATRQDKLVRDKLMEGYRQFSHLMIALCRANSVPAKSVYGLSCRDSEYRRREWVEIYFEDTGWISFDPAPWTRSDFRNMENDYIYLCPSGRDEDIMDGAYYYRYLYWGKPLIITEEYIIIEK